MNMRRFAILAVLVGAVSVVSAAATAVAVTTSVVQRLGPFHTTVAPFDSLKGGQAGGDVVTTLALDSLKVGDVVYDTTNNHVTKSATLLSYNKVAGVVVGGARTSGRATHDSSDVGTLAATANQRVIVAKVGRVWGKTSDSVYVGNEMIPGSAVSGTLKRRTTAIDSSNRIIGRAAFTIDSGKKILINLRTH